MINTVIVDDEIWVCQLIKNIVDWESMGFSIIGEAYNGSDAIALIREKRPELVLTDIRMPGIDGIGIIEQVYMMDISTKFIIISGYNDFEYAQKAIKYGALGYLLKPIDKEELKEFLTMIRTNVFNDREKEQLKNELKEDLVSSITHLKQQFFEKLLSNNSYDNEIVLQRINNELKCNFKEGVFQTVVLNVDFKLNVQTKNNIKELICQKICQDAMDVFSSYCYECNAICSEDTVVCILNYSSENRDVISKSIKELFEKFMHDNIKTSQFDITIGLGSEEKDINHLRNSYAKSMEGIRARIGLGMNKIIDISQSRFIDYNISKVFSVEQEKKLSSYLEIYDIGSAQTLLQEVFGEIGKQSNINPNLLFSLAKEILEVFYNTMKRKTGNSEDKYGKHSIISMEIDKCNSIASIQLRLNKLFSDAKSYFESINQSKNTKSVEIIKTYISNHYSEEISLKDVSEIVFLNPKYFGELFKKETGVNFSEYIINYRMDIAKDLLKNVRYRVGEVCEMVGYQDPKHFCKLFKKYVGVTPTRYKKMFT